MKFHRVGVYVKRFLNFNVGNDFLKIFYSFLLWAVMAVNVQAQDAEFSQFYAAPAYLNPSMIGFTNEARVGLNYRLQMPDFGDAFVTMALAYDQHFYKQNSSIGLLLVGDRAGQGLFNTYGVSALYAYQLQLNSSMTMKAGLSFGVFNQSINWGELVFGDMINPSTGAAIIPTLEDTPARTSLTKLDFAVGMTGFTENFIFGLSAKHITQPETSFTDFDDSDNHLSVRVALNAGYVMYLGPKSQSREQFYVSPNALFVHQAKFNQLNVGAYVGQGAIFGGLWYRHTISNADALIMLLGLKTGIFKIGYSHDFNVSNLGTPANAHEFSVIFDFGKTWDANRQNRLRKAAECPEMLK
ncbi:MAG: PorP/SprF family type IX secretion system membrane protein [Chitinophagales bacterium]